MPTRYNRGFYCRSYCLLNMFRGTTMPIIRSSRVLYNGCCLWYLVLWFSSCWSANRTHNPQLHSILFPHINDDALSKPHQTERLCLVEWPYLLLSVTNKMQLYTIFFIIVNALHVSGGFSAHHQELKNCTHSIGYMSSLLAATASSSSKQAWHIQDAMCTVL